MNAEWWPGVKEAGGKKTFSKIYQICRNVSYNLNIHFDVKDHFTTIVNFIIYCNWKNCTICKEKNYEKYKKY